MPTYEYKCEKCGYLFEEFQSISADPLKSCKKDGCNGKVTRLFSAGAGFIFKGSGFYTTDYRSDSYKKAANGDSPSAKSSSTEKKTSTPSSSSKSESGNSSTSTNSSPATKSTSSKSD